MIRQTFKLRLQKSRYEVCECKTVKKKKTHQLPSCMSDPNAPFWQGKKKWISRYIWYHQAPPQGSLHVWIMCFLGSSNFPENPCFPVLFLCTHLLEIELNWATKNTQMHIPLIIWNWWMAGGWAQRYEFK